MRWVFVIQSRLGLQDPGATSMLTTPNRVLFAILVILALGHLPWAYGQAPTVRLADQVLEVKSSSPNQLIVRLPAGIRLATYLLTVSTTGPASLSGAFNTVIFSTAAK
jgi:hypothetical protein